MSVMNISREDAATALASVEQANHRLEQARSYRGTAPYLLVWGSIWILANVAADFRPELASPVWLALALAGSAVSVGLAVRQIRHCAAVGRRSAADTRRAGRAMVLLGLTIVAYFLAMALVAGPLNGRQSNAFISLSWALAYMALGAWRGMRLFVTGAVAAAAIVTGYLYIHAHFGLWMACFAGGPLLLAGFWLRRP